MIDEVDLPEFHVPTFYAEGDAKVWMECIIGTSSYFNYRFAFRDDSTAVLTYGEFFALPVIIETQVQHDFTVIVNGRQAMIGCTVL
jgi:hypothetical protein